MRAAEQGKRRHDATDTVDDRQPVPDAVRALSNGLSSR
jgi:hypothetical protein